MKRRTPHFCPQESKQQGLVVDALAGLGRLLFLLWRLCELIVLLSLVRLVSSVSNFLVPRNSTSMQAVWMHSSPRPYNTTTHSIVLALIVSL